MTVPCKYGNYINYSHLVTTLTFIVIKAPVLCLLVGVAMAVKETTHGVPDTIGQCVKLYNGANSINSVSNISISPGIYLYAVRPGPGAGGVTWCQAYHYCRAEGYSLASIKDNETQNKIQQGLQESNTTDPIWIGGRRKDFGQNWTWVNQSLTDKPDDENNRTFDLISSCK
jgi:hypothetical protein